MSNEKNNMNKFEDPEIVSIFSWLMVGRHFEEEYGERILSEQSEHDLNAEDTEKLIKSYQKEFNFEERLIGQREILSKNFKEGEEDE